MKAFVATNLLLRMIRFDWSTEGAIYGAHRSVRHQDANLGSGHANFGGGTEAMSCPGPQLATR